MITKKVCPHCGQPEPQTPSRRGSLSIESPLRKSSSATETPVAAPPSPVPDDAVRSALRSLQVPLLQEAFKEQRSFARTNAKRNLLIKDPSEEREEMNARLNIAAEFVASAIEGRSPYIPLRGHYFRPKVAAVLRSSVYQYILWFLTIGQCFLAIWEPMSLNDSSFDSELYKLFAIELSVVFLYLVDASLESFAYGAKRYVEKRWNIVYVIVISAMFFELLIALAVQSFWAGFWCRFLRPVLVICRWPSIRRQASRILSAVPKTLFVCCSGMIVVATYASIGHTIFNGMYSSSAHPRENFDSFWKSFLQMVVLTTAENYPGILHPGIDRVPVVAVLFFISYIFVSSWFFLSLILAVVYDFYRIQHLEKVSSERIKEQQNLLLAFRILKGNDEDKMEFPFFYRLMRLVNPWMSEGQYCAIFHMMDKDNSGRIDLREFLLLVEVMQYRYSRIDRPQGWFRVMFCFSDRFYKLMWSSFVQKAGYFRNVASSPLFQNSATFLACANAVLIVLYDMDVPQFTTFLYNCFSWFFLVCIGIELLIVMLAYGILPCWERRTFSCFLFFSSLLIEFFSPYNSLIYIWRAIRILRLAVIFERLRFVIEILSQTTSIILEMIVLLVLTFYMYSYIGMGLFSKNSLASSPHSSISDDAATRLFDTFGHAMLSCFQIATTNNWNDVMYPLVDRTHLAYSLYFVSFYFLMALVLLNILTTLIISAYLYVFHRKGALEQVFMLRFVPSTGGPDQDMEPTTRVTEADVLERSRLEEIIMHDDEKHQSWRIVVRKHYSRALVQQELPEFNDYEIDKLQRRVRRLEKDLEVRLERTPSWSKARFRREIANSIRMNLATSSGQGHESPDSLPDLLSIIK